MMDPLAVTVGVRFARRLRPMLVLAAGKSTDPIAFFGGMLASVVGTIAGLIGAHTTGELLRITLAKLDENPSALIIPAAAIRHRAARGKRRHGRAMTPEIVEAKEAGRVVGELELPAGLNPYELGTIRALAWETARLEAIARRLIRTVACRLAIP